MEYFGKNIIFIKFYLLIHFLDTTPIGRILNRFSKDVDTIDSVLPEQSRLFGYTFSLVLGTVVLISAVFPLFIAALAPAIVFYLFLASYYRSTSRELKRLDSITRSPLFAVSIRYIFCLFLYPISVFTALFSMLLRTCDYKSICC